MMMAKISMILWNRSTLRDEKQHHFRLKCNSTSGVKIEQLLRYKMEVFLKQTRPLNLRTRPLHFEFKFSFISVRVMILFKDYRFLYRRLQYLESFCMGTVRLQLTGDHFGCDWCIWRRKAELTTLHSWKGFFDVVHKRQIEHLQKYNSNYLSIFQFVILPFNSKKKGRKHFA